MHRVRGVAVALLHHSRDEGSAGSDEARERNRLNFEAYLLVRILEVELGAVFVRGKPMSNLVHVRNWQGERDGVLVSWLEVDDEASLRAIVLGTANIEQAESRAAGDQNPDSTNLRRCAVHCTR